MSPYGVPRTGPGPHGSLVNVVMLLLDNGSLQRSTSFFSSEFIFQRKPNKEGLFSGLPNKSSVLLRNSLDNVGWMYATSAFMSFFVTRKK